MDLGRLLPPQLGEKGEPRTVSPLACPAHPGGEHEGERGEKVEVMSVFR